MLYYAQGTAIVAAEEYGWKSREELPQFMAAYQKNPNTAVPVEFSTGRLEASNYLTGIDTGDSSGVERFQPIGMEKPLVVRIREIYTGKNPVTGLFPGKRDLLVTSAVKSIFSYEEEPRALNFLKKKVAAYSRIKRPAAVEEGTPIVFYSPALLDRSLTLTLTMVFDTFPQEIFKTIGALLQTTAGIPIFVAQSGYLLAAGSLTQIFGALGEALFDHQPAFEQSEPLDISLAGEQTLDAGFRLVTIEDLDRVDSEFRVKYHVNSCGQVVDDNGIAYAGDIPYVVITIDGTPDDKLKSFAPVTASAAILSRFFGSGDRPQQIEASMMDALKLYSDFRFRKEADRLNDQINRTTDEAAKADLVRQREALTKNILEDLLKP
jgi:hypothetical protein